MRSNIEKKVEAIRKAFHNLSILNGLNRIKAINNGDPETIPMRKEMQKAVEQLSYKLQSLEVGLIYE